MAERLVGEWVTHATIRTVYSSPWLSLRIDDVERPDGTRVEHAVVQGRDAAGMVVHCAERGYLMIWRHRFMPGSWGWEIPAGNVDPDESPQDTAYRECYEETGWRAVGPAVHLSTHHPSCGTVSQTYHLFEVSDAIHEGAPLDANEAARIEWRTPDAVAADLRSGEISDGLTSLGMALSLVRNGYGALMR